MPKEKEEKFKILKVMVEESYYIPIYDDERTKINGWSMEQVIEDWFKRHSMSSYHATRDAYLIGGSKKMISTEIKDET